MLFILRASFSTTGICILVMIIEYNKVIKFDLSVKIKHLLNKITIILKI